MICPTCTTRNPAQARFCFHCGEALAGGHVCTTCHTLLPAQANYCFHCGMVIIRAGRPCPACGAQVAAGHAHCLACGQALVAAPTPPAATPPAPAKPPAPAPSPGTPSGAQPSLAALRPALARYLPARLYEPLERRPTERHLHAVRDHLLPLLRAVKTYLPRPVVVAPQPAGVAAGGMYEGTFLFVDVSGFTPLSERLGREGQGGAERVTEIMNDLFFELVTILFDHEGTLLKFGGDALLGLFAAGDEAAMKDGARQAARAALAMQDAMARFGAIEAAGETSALQIKCGLSSGPYFAAHIGTEQNMGYVTTGHTVNQAEQAEGQAAPGEVMLAASTRSLLAEAAEVEARGDDYFRLLACAPEEGEGQERAPAVPRDDAPQGPVEAQIAYLVERLERLTPYLAADLLPRMVTNPRDIQIAPDHRQVTVIFANYVGISNLIEALGESHPELITQQLNDYFVHMAGIVEKYEGTLARMDQYAVGDRLVIFFGAPRAHEDDPVRALYTALDMQTATRQHFAALQTPAGIYRFRQRIGINTGTLFAGNVGAPELRQEYTLMGDDINMAARLMGKAGWQEIFISARTRDRVSAFFELEDKGALKVKGKEILIPTFQVLGTRQEIGPVRGLGGQTPLVGRAEALAQALHVGETVRQGRGQILAIVGDSGRGKSRLSREFKQTLLGRDDAEPLRWLSGQALSFGEQIGYWLVAQVLLDALDLPEDASSDDILFNLWERGEALLGGEIAREAIPFLAYLLDLELEGEWALVVAELDPKARQKQTFWAAREFFTALAREKPTIILLDDLHWADEASLALITDLLAVTDRAPLLLCLLFRERQDKGVWRLRNEAAGAFAHRYTEIELAPLNDDQCLQLVGSLLPGARFSPDTQAEILEKAAGNPFYLEEVVRTLIDSQAVVPAPEAEGQWQVTEKIEHIAVPATLQGAIVARIDRLTEEARQALQMAAVIGRRFWVEVFRSLAGAEAEMEGWLSQLERDGLVRPAEQQAAGTLYAFPDALVQEVAYDSLLVQRRQEFHRQVGEALEILFAGRLEQECEMLAYHFSRSEATGKAITYLKMAALKAQAEFANQTAVTHFTALLALLAQEASAWEEEFEILKRRQQIFGLLGKQEARERDLERMGQLAAAADDPDRQADVRTELADLYQWTGRYEESVREAEAALARKRQSGDEAGQAAALHQLGVVNYYRGEYTAAQPALEAAADLRRAAGDPAGESWSELYLCMIHFVSGNYGTANRHNEQALSAAEVRRDWLLMGIHLNNGGRIAHRLGEYEKALALFERSLEMRERVGDKTGQGFTLFGMGLVYANLERYAEADAAFRQSLEIRQQIDDERGISYALYGLGRVALEQGELEEAQTFLQEARALHETLGLKGELVADLSFLGQVHLRRGQLAEARARSEDAMALLAEQRNVEEVQQIYLNHYRVLDALADPAAPAFLKEAEEAMTRQAAAISDPDTRRTFLEQVRVNEAIRKALEKG